MVSAARRRSAAAAGTGRPAFQIGPATLRPGRSPGRRQQPLKRFLGPLARRGTGRAAALGQHLVGQAGFGLAGAILAITIIGLPWTPAAFRIAGFSAWPFGRVVVDRDSGVSMTWPAEQIVHVQVRYRCVRQ